MASFFGRAMYLLVLCAELRKPCAGVDRARQCSRPGHGAVARSGPGLDTNGGAGVSDDVNFRCPQFADDSVERPTVPVEHLQPPVRSITIAVPEEEPSAADAASRMDSALRIKALTKSVSAIASSFSRKQLLSAPCLPLRHGKYSLSPAPPEPNCLWCRSQQRVRHCSDATGGRAESRGDGEIVRYAGR